MTLGIVQKEIHAGMGQDEACHGAGLAEHRSRMTPPAVRPDHDGWRPRRRVLPSDAYGTILILGVGSARASARR